jgi:hypothetical protein
LRYLFSADVTLNQNGYSFNAAGINYSNGRFGFDPSVSFGVPLEYRKGGVLVPKYMQVGSKRSLMMNMQSLQDIPTMEAAYYFNCACIKGSNAYYAFMYYGQYYSPQVGPVIVNGANFVNLAATATVSDGALDLAKFAKGTAKFANGLSIVAAGYQLATGNDNTSTWVDVGVTTAGIVVGGIVGATAAPFVAAGAVAYGIWSFAGGSAWIDSNWGYR